MLISDWDILPQKNNMKTSKSFVLASEVRTATAGAHVQEQTNYKLQNASMMT